MVFLLKPLISQSHIPKNSLSPPLPTLVHQTYTYLYLTPSIWGTQGSLTIQETSPAAQAHAQPNRHIAGWGGGPDSSGLCHPVSPPLSKLLSTMVLFLISHRRKPHSLHPVHSLFGRHFSSFHQEMACPDRCYVGGGEGSDPSLPQGVT